MNFSFGIITNGTNDSMLETIISSIEKQNISDDKYEIIIVGNSKVSRKNTTIYEFNEHAKPAWITKKKNMITQYSKFENIVYMHDYIQLCDDWYSGFLQYGNDFKACMTKIVNPDNTRYRDWTMFPLYPNVQSLNLCNNHNVLLPYDWVHLSKYQYFSGAYWISKKTVMEEFPLDERFSWGESEDIDWSKRYLTKYDFYMNKFSTVQLLKYKPRIFNEVAECDYAKLKDKK